MDKRSVRVLIVALFVLMAALAIRVRAAEESAQKASGREKKEPVSAAKEEPKKAEKPTQTAVSPQTQTQSADDDVPVLIEETPTSKNTTTINTPLGIQEGSQRRHETYTRITNQAKHEALETRSDLEKSEAAQSDTEDTAKDKGSEAEKKKPPQR